METKKNCPNCNKPLDDQALQGLCPDCLLKAGWPTATEAEPSGEGFTPPTLDELAGLFPQLEILELIGKGGMGAVFKARQPNLDRMVALKILPVKQGTDPGFAARFTREARALAKLNHRHIVGVHDFGQVEGFHYFIMEYVDGLNLRQVQQAGKLSAKEALGIVPQICEALQFAHDEGVVHRDIKPENVLLDQKGQIRIADFGLAKILGTERSNFTLTEPNHVMGTPHYMAPEQVEHPTEVDHRADIYSLGVVFYELLTGELPLGKFAPPSRKVQVDVRLDEVVLRALAKEPQLRYQQASEVKTEVETIASSPPQTAGPSAEDARLIEQAKQQLKGPAIGLIVAGILEWLVVPLGIAGVILLGGFRPGPLEVAVLLSCLPLAAFIIYAGLKAKQAEAYAAGIIAAVLAIVVTPANTIGLPVGIWALVVLTRKEIRAAFTLRAKTPPAASPRPRQAGRKVLGVLVLHALVLALVGGGFVGYVVPRYLAVLSALQVSLPPLTLRIVGLVDFLQHYGLPVFALLLGLDGIILWLLNALGMRRARLCWSGGLIVGLALLVGGMLLNLTEAIRQLPPEGRLGSSERFDPTRERSFIRPGHDREEIRFWDLDTNTLVQPPFPVDIPEPFGLFHYLSATSLAGRPELQQWLHDTGVDLVFAWQPWANGAGWRLMGLGAERLNPRWLERSFDAVEAQHLIVRRTGELRMVGNQVKYGQSKALCLRTDQGAPGVLEWESLFDGATDGLKIRYKLLRSASGPAPAPTANEVFFEDNAKAPFVARFPQGTIELLGVCEHPSAGRDWWAPDGSPAQAGPFRIRGSHSRIYDGQQAREFVMRRHGFPEGASFTTWHVKSASGSAGGAVVSDEGRDLPGLSMLSVTLPDNLQTATLRMGVGLDAWTTLGRQKPGQSGTRSLVRNGLAWTFSFLDAVQVGADTRLTLAYTNNRYWQMRTVAVTDSGEQLTGPAKQSITANLSHITTTFVNTSLDSIKEFLFQVRPYHWVAFRNVSLVRGQKTSVQIQHATEVAVAPQEAVQPENNTPQTALPNAEEESIVDFNDSAFWGRQIKRHLEAVRSLDVALETERQVFGEDPNVPEKRYRHRIDLKWDRDKRWIDCVSQQIDSKRSSSRIIQGPEVAWVNRAGHDWTKLKAGSGGPEVGQFGSSGRVRRNAFEHGFSVARGIVCSPMLHMTQTQGAVDWAQAEFKHRVDDLGRHVLEKTQMTPGLDGEQVEAGMQLIGQWEQGAFKLLELRGICRAYDVDMLMEGYADHVYQQGAWVPRQATEYDWTTPQPGASRAEAVIHLDEKRITTVKRLVANRTMQAHEFEGFRPPAGSRVTDKIQDKHYTVWPDLDAIRANGGKERVSIRGRVYLDGRPGDGVAVTTSTRYDPNKDIYRGVQAETDVDGRFELAGLVPGFSYRVKVEDEAGHTAETTVRLSNQGQDHEGLKIDMTSGLTVTGRVTDMNDLPIENALVKFRDKPTVKTDVQGHYTVNGLYADQGYEVEVGAQGYAPLDPGGDVITDNFRIQLDPNGQPLPFDVTLEKERILHGRLIDQDDNPVEGVRVNVWSAPFGIGEGSTWKWYDTYTDANGHFRVGNLGDRIYSFFIGQYGTAYHNPLESPVVIRVTGDSYMPALLPGRTLVADSVREPVQAFESAYRSFFRLKEYRQASIQNQGGRLVSQWLEQLADSNVALQCELLARLGSIPAYPAHDTLEQILGGQILAAAPRVAGTETHFSSTVGNVSDARSCPTHLVECPDPAIICLAMRALARSGFVSEHAQLLIDKLGHDSALVRAYAIVALAEMTGVYQGEDRPQWQRWVDQYRQYRSVLDTRGNCRLLADMCRIARDHERTPESVERVMAAWQGSSAGALRFREVVGGQRGADLWRFLASVKLEGDKPIQYGYTRGYWRSDMFQAAGHHKHDVKVQFERSCTWGDMTFEPDRWYVIPALFRDGYQGKWEIVDLRLDDIQPVVSSP